MNISSNILKSFHGFLPTFYKYINPVLNYKEWKGVNLRENHIKILMILSFQGEVTPTFLSDALYVQKGSLTTLMQKLVQMNMIERVFNEKNERSYKIRLTDEGRSFLEYSESENIKGFAELFKTLGHDEAEIIINGFNTLNAFLNQMNK